jgi:hypothetical protein
MIAGKIVEPEKSVFRVSRATFEEWDRLAREAGHGENRRRTHEDRETTRSKALAGRTHGTPSIYWKVCAKRGCPKGESVFNTGLPNRPAFDKANHLYVARLRVFSIVYVGLIWRTSACYLVSAA